MVLGISVHVPFSMDWIFLQVLLHDKTKTDKTMADPFDLCL